jgi:hypothetical protein
MKAHIKAIFLFSLVLLFVGFASADPLTIGLPADTASGNCFPFGCGPGDRYQQVYSSSEFPTSLSIGMIEFFHTVTPGGNLNSGTYTFYFSTTTTSVDGLDTTVFDNNLGPDNQLFGVFVLTGGAAPSVLPFSGTSFSYDPTLGNLLLDIQISGISSGNSYFDARNGTAGGVFSRAHNFGSGFSGYGLVTRFSSGTSVPEPSTLLLLGLGLAGVGLLHKRF